MANARCLPACQLCPWPHWWLPPPASQLSPREAAGLTSLKVQRVKARLEALHRHAVTAHQELGVAGGGQGAGGRAQAGHRVGMVGGRGRSRIGLRRAGGEGGGAPAAGMGSCARGGWEGPTAASPRAGRQGGRAGRQAGRRAGGGNTLAFGVRVWQLHRHGSRGRRGIHSYSWLELTSTRCGRARRVAGRWRRAG